MPSTLYVMYYTREVYGQAREMNLYGIFSHALSRKLTVCNDMQGTTCQVYSL